MPKLGTTTWDAALARRLYDKGATYKHIGEQIGVAVSLVGQFPVTYRSGFRGGQQASTALVEVWR
jgi:hypothetical protein